MRSVLLTLLLDSKPQCIADIHKLLQDAEYQNTIKIHRELEGFWQREFERVPKSSIQSLTNKLSLMLMPGSPQQRIFSTLENDLNFKEITDGGKFYC